MGSADDSEKDNRNTATEGTPPPKKKKGSVFKYVLLAAAVGAFLTAWLRERDREQELADEVLPPVTVTFPEHGTLFRKYSLNGFLETESIVTILPKISGTLISLTVDAGDRVNEGEIIGLVDQEPYELNLRQAETAYVAAKATWERVEKMYKSKAASQDAYEQAKAQFETTESRYELAQLNYEYTRLRAPVSGVVLKRHISQGALVAPEVPIVTVGDLKKLVVKAKIPEQYYRVMLEGRRTIEITARIPALDDHPYSARIDSVAPLIDPETRSFETVLKLEGETGLLRPGMFVAVTFILDRREGICYLPYQALVSGQYLWYVDTDQPAASAQRVEYTVGFANDEFFMIPEEWADRPFILTGQHFIRAGQQVKVLNSEILER